MLVWLEVVRPGEQQAAGDAEHGAHRDQQPPSAAVVVATVNEEDLHGHEHTGDEQKQAEDRDEGGHKHLRGLKRARLTSLRACD